MHKSFQVIPPSPFSQAQPFKYAHPRRYMDWMDGWMDRSFYRCIIHRLTRICSGHIRYARQPVNPSAVEVTDHTVQPNGWQKREQERRKRRRRRVAPGGCSVADFLIQLWSTTSEHVTFESPDFCFQRFYVHGTVGKNNNKSSPCSARKETKGQFRSQ